MRSRLILKGTAALTALLMAGFASLVEAALSAPSLTATASSASQINLSWTDPNPNESGQQVERSLSQTTGFTVIATLGKNVTSYSSTGLAASTRYYFRVKATTKSNGGSPYSNVANATTLAGTAPPPSGVPAAPSNLTASGYSSTQINVFWTDNSSNETAFKVERGTSSGGPFAQVGTTAGASWADSGLAASTTYYYRVRAYNSYGNSAYSNTGFAATLGGAGVPATPSGLSATAASASQINLAWGDTSSNETGFKIERSTATAGWAQVATTGVNVRTFANTGLSAGAAYSYRVRAYNTSGDSGYSNTGSATTQSGGSAGAWTKWYAGGGAYGDSGKAVAVDSSGNVAVAGQFHGIVNLGGGSITSYTNATTGPTVDAFVAKYSPSGGHLWSRGIGGGTSDAATGVDTDSGGNTVITGYQNSSQVDYGGGLLATRGSNDIFVAKYSSTGGYVWAKTIGGVGADAGSALATDGSGNVLVTGYISAGSGVDFGGGALSSAGTQDAFLVKYSSVGAHVWSKRFGSTGYDQGVGVGTDGSGNVVVVGTFEGTINLGGAGLTSAGGRDIFVAKFSSTGGHLWSKRFGGTGNDDVRGVAVDGAGDVVLTGQFLGSINFGGLSLSSAGYDDIFLAKLAGATGGHVWSKRFGSSSAPDAGYGIAVDGSNNVAITGYFAGSVDFGGGALLAQVYDIFVAKFSSAGTYLTAKRFGDPAGLFASQYANAIGMSSGGSMFVAGHYVGTLNFGTGGQATSTAYGGTDSYMASIGP